MATSKIYRPCDTCVHEFDCELFGGCRQWKAYFRAYWWALRKQLGYGKGRGA